MLLWIAFLSFQKVEDGTAPSYIFFALPALVLFIASTYVALDIGFSVSGFFDTSIDRLQSAWLFSFTILWPALAIIAYFVVNIVVTLTILRETRPVSELCSVCSNNPRIAQPAPQFFSPQLSSSSF